jgi:hypothetical protein
MNALSENIIRPCSNISCADDVIGMNYGRNHSLKFIHSTVQIWPHCHVQWEPCKLHPLFDPTIGCLATNSLGSAFAGSLLISVI